ncbi:hypothetical protein SLS55_005895 [Diplodia seriata]|uniref:Six-bladed beta-propeller-like protein n=1 Tax=Diplodia seriata TaxID=420778 RepID=A0ABR3CHZ7_9PEZI
MALLTRILSAVFLAACAANAAPTLQADTSLRLIHQFPLGIWAENIAMRGNGNLLVTFAKPTASLHQLSPLSPTPHSNLSTTLVHTFANHTQLTGIAELTRDVFAVIADNSIYAVAFHRNTSHTITHLATIRTAGTLNGAAALPDARTLLISDSTLGLIWALDTSTGAHGVALQHNATMSPTTDLGLVLGVNGLRYHAASSTAYYVNTPRRLYCRVPIDARTGEARGEYEVVARGVMADDFALGGGEVAVGWLAGLEDNVVTRVDEEGGMQVVAGALGSLDVAGATSAAFAGGLGAGRGWLYVTTGGASAAPVNGTVVEGGKVVGLWVE